MATVFSKTCWRGLELSHPADWELAVLCGPGEPGRLTFADRRYQRLDIRWMKLDYRPNLKLMLDKYRQQEEKQKIKVEPFSTAQWQCVMRTSENGQVVHAGKFLETQRLLVEATIIWPDRRDKSVENAILSSVCFHEQEVSSLWQAMGLAVTAPVGFELSGVSAKVGRIRWEFKSSDKRGPQLGVEQLAMPEYWLESPLRDWLAEELPDGFEANHQEPITINTHSAQKIQSRRRINALSAMRWRRQLRTDVAWHCPSENRIYHTWITQASRQEHIELPDEFRVRCCSPVTAAMEAIA